MIATITVTAEDVFKGKRSSCVGCPIALAITRSLAPGWRIGVGCPSWHLTHPVFCPDGQFGHPVLPREAVAFIDAFDHQKPVSPITFQLDIPDEALASTTP